MFSFPCLPGRAVEQVDMNFFCVISKNLTASKEGDILKEVLFYMPLTSIRASCLWNCLIIYSYVDLFHLGQ